MASPVNSISTKLLESVPDCVVVVDARAQQNDIELVGENAQQQQQQQQQQNQVFADDPRALQLALELSMASLSDCNDLRTSTASPKNLQYFCNFGKQQQQQNHEPKSTYISQQQSHLEYEQTLQKQQSEQQQQQQQLKMHHQTIHHHHDDAARQKAAIPTIASTPEIPRLLSTFDLSLLPTPLISLRTPNIENNIKRAAPPAAAVMGHADQHALLTDNIALNTSMLLTSNDVSKPLVAPNGINVLTSLDERSKKSQNMTECVPVPSSEHVAEIVGRQGCKIKALRAKTNTYIKTPVRGDEPVFIITGRKEDVAKAQREILSAADHFSLIRATRRPSYDGSGCSPTTGIEGNTNECLNGDAESMSNGIVSGGGCGGGGGGGNGGGGGGNGGGFNTIATPSQSGLPLKTGQITIQVRVPYRVVGLVVGTKGATIKHIQQETQTYIVTPSREKEPIFEVTGLPDNVQVARKKIEAHIALRTGNITSAVPNNNNNGNSNHNNINNNTGAMMANAFGNVLPSNNISTETSNGINNSVHSINTLSQFLNQSINLDFLTSMYKDNIVSTYMTNGNNGHNNNSNGNGSTRNTNSCDVVYSTNTSNIINGKNNLNSHNITHNERLLLSSNAIANLKTNESNHHKFHAAQKLRISASPSDAETKFNVKQSTASQAELNMIDAAVVNMHFESIQQQHQQQQSQTLQHMAQFQNATNSENHKFNGDTTALTFQTIDTCLNGSLLTTGATDISGNDLTILSADHNIMSNHFTRTISGNNINNNNNSSNNLNAFRSEVVNRILSASGFTRSCSSASSTSSTKSVNNCGEGGSISSSRPELLNIWRNIADSLEVDEGISESPNIWNLQTNQTPSLAATFTDSHCSPVNSISPTDSLLNEINANTTLTAGDHVVVGMQSNLTQPKKSPRRFCLGCSEKEVTTSYVPCGHNTFCNDCSKRFYNRGTDASSDINVMCPICSLQNYQSMQIAA